MANENFSFSELKEFDNHQFVTFLNDPKSGLKGFIAIHRGISVPAFGATRLWRYSCEIDVLKDVLNLSKLMSYKSALAGLPYGGAKAVILAYPVSDKQRELLLRTYVKRVNCLGGHFITGSDVGINNDDVKMMKKESPYIVGVECDPVKHTVFGVLCGIKTCMKEIFGKDSISGRTFAIQGLGKTGAGILKVLYDEAEKIYVSDINQDTINKLKIEFPKIEIVSPLDIHKQKVDVFSPCALGQALTFKNISSLACKIVVGSANNQLEDSQIGELLYKLGILYAPDYVVNAGGLIAVTDEYINQNSREERVTKKVSKIKKTLGSIIEKSKRSKKATNVVADEMAERIFNKIS